MHEDRSTELLRLKGTNTTKGRVLRSAHDLFAVAGSGMYPGPGVQLGVHYKTITAVAPCTHALPPVERV
jgi:hypothetical protein